MGALVAAAPPHPQPQSCTWTQVILAMRKIGPDCEILAWTGRKEGLTAQRFCELITAFAPA